MARSPLTIAEANLLLHQVLNMPVSLPWKGYGSAIFLELGTLAPLERPRQRHQKGDATFYIGWDWRVEEGAKVVYGSSNSRPQIVDGISTLIGTSIKTIAIQGQVPELFIEFSNGQRLISAAMCTDVSEWNVRLPGSRWIDCSYGIVYVGNGDNALGLTPEEESESENIRITAERWGVPVSGERAGHCNSCRAMVRIDGDHFFLDYGVCSSRDSPYDGRVVNMKSSCPAYTAIDN